MLDVLPFRSLPCLLLALAAATQVGLAGTVSTDGAFAPRQNISNPGGNFVIPSSLGRKVDGNLFHSFDQFDLIKDEVATFNGPGDVKNILARVTGDSPSSINGTIRSNISGANFFLMNPKGVMFGANAAIDVTGSFTVTTANYLNLTNGGRFDAKLGGQDSLTSASVSAFGFLGPPDRPASVTFSGSQVRLADGAGLSVIAGDIRFQRFDPPPPTSGTDPEPSISPRLFTPGGDVTLLSVAAPGEFSPDGSGVHTGAPFQPAPGVIMMHTGFDTSGGKGGAFVVRAPSLSMSDTKILSNTSAAGTGGRLDFKIDGALELGQTSSILSRTTGAGTSGAVSISAGSLELSRTSLIGSSAGITATATAGPVQIRAGQLLVSDGSFISGSTEGPGRGAPVDVVVTGSLRLDHAGIFSKTQLPASAGQGGPAGRVHVQAGSIQVVHDASIAASTDGTGAGGDVEVTARSIQLVRGGRIESNANSSGTGGSVAVAADEILIDGQSRPSNTGLFAATNSTGPGGNVTVEAGQLSILKSGLVTTRAAGPGQGGDVSIKADDLFIFRGQSKFFTGIAADSATANGGLGGDVSVEAGRVRVVEGGQISSNTQSARASGNVSVRADELTLIGGRFLPSVIGTESTPPGDGGPGGDVRVVADRLTVLSGGRISASTFGAGAGGGVAVQAREIVISQGTSANGTGIFAESVSETEPGAGGSVRVETDKLILTSGGRISASTFGPGDGGGVFVSARDAFFTSFGSTAFTGVRAESLSPTESGAGGSVRADFVRLELDGGGISATTVGPGAGGSVAVGATRLTLDRSAAIEASATGAGVAGSVAIAVVEPLEIRGLSSVRTTSAASDAGTVSIASETDIFLENGSVTVQASVGNAGRIALAARNVLSMRDSQLLAEAGLNGGDIFIDPVFVILEHSRISANAVAIGGNILLQADNFFSSASPITATGSTAGTVEIAAPQLDLSGALATLSSQLEDASLRLQERCAMRLGGELSSFLVLGRGGVSAAPDEPQFEATVSAPRDPRGGSSAGGPRR
jgi:filamentous hemagglutinin family protein